MDRARDVVESTSKGLLGGKTVIITGGTTGLGAAAAKLFRDQGAAVVVTGLNPETLARRVKN